MSTVFPKTHTISSSHRQDFSGIVSHLKKQAGPASVPLKSEEEFEKFINDKDASVVGK